MLQWVDFLTVQFNNFFNLLNQIRFDIVGVQVGFADILLGFLILSIVATVFWKGAHT